MSLELAAVVASVLSLSEARNVTERIVSLPSRLDVLMASEKFAEAAANLALCVVIATLGCTLVVMYFVMTTDWGPASTGGILILAVAAQLLPPICSYYIRRPLDEQSGSRVAALLYTAPSLATSGLFAFLLWTGRVSTITGIVALGIDLLLPAWVVTGILASLLSQIPQDRMRRALPVMGTVFGIGVLLEIIAASMQ